MTRINFVAASPLILTMLCSCGRAGTALPNETEAIPQSLPAVSTTPGAVTTPMPASLPTPSYSVPVAFPLSDPGPYFAGNRAYSLVDESRDGREIRLTIWYPALQQLDAQGRVIPRDAAPDMSGAPYPLILTGANSGDLLFLDHLVSHGYVMTIVHFGQAPTYRWDQDMIDYPRDLLFALDQLAKSPPEGLEGIVDTDNVGVAGYSGDGSAAFAVSGARLDPEFYRSQCDRVPDLYPSIFYFWVDYACSFTEDWEAFAASVGSTITESVDGLWQPITDRRIRAVAAMATASPWMYGERGLAEVDRPVLIISPTEDEYDSHAMVTDTFEQIGNPDKVMISLVGQTHMSALSGEPQERIHHFTTAFFGYYLQGRDDYARYFSEDFVEQFDDLAWGVYEE